MLPLCLSAHPPLEGSGMDASILLNLDVFTLMLMALKQPGIHHPLHHLVDPWEIPGLGLWWWSSLCALAAQSLFFIQAFFPISRGSGWPTCSSPSASP